MGKCRPSAVIYGIDVELSDDCGETPLTAAYVPTNTALLKLGSTPYSSSKRIFAARLHFDFSHTRLDIMGPFAGRAQSLHSLHFLTLHDLQKAR